MSTVVRAPLGPAFKVAKQPHQAPVVTSLYRLSVAQYDRMIEAGVLTEHDNTELIDGLSAGTFSDPADRRGQFHQWT